MTPFPPEVLARAQEAAQARLEAFEAALLDEGDPPEGAELYCGCATCQVREIINAVLPVFEATAEEATGTAIEISRDYDEAMRDA